MIIFRNLISIYLDPHSPPSTSNLKAIPLNQILHLANNIANQPLKQINEVLLKVLLENIKPSQNFKLIEEIKKVRTQGIVNLKCFKKLHYKKVMMARHQIIHRVKVMRDLAQEIKQKTSQENMPVPEAITSFDKDTHMFNKFFHTVVYINDKICMVTLREMSDLKIFTEVVWRLVSLMRKSDIQYMVEQWFGWTKTERSEGSEGEGSKIKQEGSPALNNFLKIFGSSQQSQQNSDSRSQLSDFSLNFDRLNRPKEDFFDF